MFNLWFLVFLGHITKTNIFKFTIQKFGNLFCFIYNYSNLYNKVKTKKIVNDVFIAVL